MKFVLYLALSALLMSATSAFSQDIVWQHLYGDPEWAYESVSAICPTHDGSLLAVGPAGIDYGYSDCVGLLKFSPDGDSLWRKRICGTTAYRPYGAASTYDGGFIIAGFTGDVTSQSHLFYMKTDQNGNKLWEKTYDTGEQYSRVIGVEETADSGFIITGHVGQFPSADIGNSSVLIIRTDSLGAGGASWNEPEWAKTFDINSNDYNRSYCVRQTADGGYVVAGSTGDLSGLDMFLLRLNAIGDSLWCNVYEDVSSGSVGWSVAEHADGGFLMVGWIGSGSYHLGPRAVRTDATGSELNSWKLTVGSLYSVRSDSDGGFITTGDDIVIRLDDIGDTTWCCRYEPPDTSIDLREIIQVGSGEYILAGDENPHNGVNDDYVYLARIQPWGTYICGDADASSSVDIDDVVYLIAYIFSGGPAPEPLQSGDADCSGGVDIDDVVYLIAYIFSGGFAPCDIDGDGWPDC